MIRRLTEEAGYSLVEVMVAITVLLVAIIPMVAMFDMSLETATLGSNYDRARSLANTNLDRVRSLAFASARTTYKPVNEPAPPTGTGPGTPVSCNQGRFTCTVTTTYVNDDFNPSPTSRTRMQVQVTVTWENGGKSYTTTGLKTR